MPSNTKCDRSLLKSAPGTTKCDRLLLQSASGMTKCDSYYKVRRNKAAVFFHIYIIFMFLMLKNKLSKCFINVC